MTDDLHAKIRKRLEQRANSCTDREHNALIGLLELHPADPHECPAFDGAWGRVTNYDRTCATLREIAKALGVRVPA